MDRQADRQTDGLRDRQTDGRRDRQADGLRDRRTDGQADGQTDSLWNKTSIQKVRLKRGEQPNKQSDNMKREKKKTTTKL